MEFIIKPKERFSLGIKELMEYRELFYFFTWRDIKIKYKQTFLGFLWAIIQPLFMTVVFTSFIGDSIVQKTNLQMPYHIFALSGMVLWALFSSGMTNAANSMLNNSNIIKKIYFPRLIIPISSILVALFDFFITLIIFACMILYFQINVNYSHLLFIPLSVLITCFSALGCGSALAALNIKYRDVRYVLPFLIQGLLFLTPVLFPINISNNLVAKTALKLNPLSGALELLRSLFVGYTVDYSTIIISGISSLILFIVGILYFKKTENYFADLV